MVLNGDGHTGITRGNSLLAYETINQTIATKCGREKPTIIATNPPFAGVGDGRIEAEYILSQYDSGHRWKVQNGEYIKTDKILSTGCPPEMLFLERCIDWLVPGGRLAIVMPKSVLDTDTYHPIRSILFDRCVLNAVITLDKNTFQPHTGVRTCILLLTKKTDDWKHMNYPIFMAISESCGQDSEGAPKYTLDDNNEPTSIIDEDISEIIQKYSEFKSRDFLEEEYTFQVYLDDLEGKLLINPQRYRHSLNVSITKVGKISQNEGWYQTTIGEIEGIELFKGPRLKSENIQVNDYVNDSVEPFYTPSAILQNKSESAKLFDISRANQKQLKMIQMMRIFRGDVVVTRSGSIGRVKYITSRFEGAIGSDDLIRVRIQEENMQLYLFMFLQHQFGKDQMIRNEYGAVQQHLEPSHIAAIKIPMPYDISKLSEIIGSAKEQILTLEKYDELVITSQKNLETLYRSMV